jgi:glucose/arabinose dehydrogenase
VSARRYLVPLVAVAAGLALGACADDDEERSAEPPAATKPATDGGDDGAADQPDDGQAEPSARRRVRLLKLGDFDQPTYVAAPRGDRRRFVVEREGRIRVVKRGRTLGTPFLDVSSDVSTGGESGMLSMAFAPDYESSGRFYVYYTDRGGFLTIAQFRRSGGDPDRADPGSRRTVMHVPHPRSNHKGGQLQFGPDGLLYAGFGDGGGGGDPDENAQNLGRILGKMIRIDPRPGGGYSIPASNPFRGRAGARGEIYAYGLRNPYRFSFDRATGALAIGDVGQNAVEEIDYVPSPGGGRPPRGGYNFGWDVFEGRSRYEGGSAPGHVPPVITHPLGGTSCAIIGGYVIRDRSLGRGWTGHYVYGDHCNPVLRVAALRRGSSPTRATRLRVSGLASFGEDGRGRVYAVSLNGPVFRIARR